MIYLIKFNHCQNIRILQKQIRLYIEVFSTKFIFQKADSLILNSKRLLQIQYQFIIKYSKYLKINIPTTFEYFKLLIHNQLLYQKEHYQSNNINLQMAPLNYILLSLTTLLILYSVYLIFRSEYYPDAATQNVIINRATAPPTVNIKLDSGFNNFKNHTTLSLDKLACELYQEKNKHVNALGKANAEQYDTRTSELLLSLIKQINKVKTQKNLLENLKVSKPKKIILDTSKLEKLYNKLMKTKDIIDTKQQQIKVMKDNFTPNVVSGKQWEIDVEKQLVSYLQKRLDYLKSLRPKTQDQGTQQTLNRIGRTLDTSQSTIYAIIQDIDKSKNVIRYDDEINKLQNLKKYWRLRLEEIRKCQKTDRGYRQDQSIDIYAELQRLGRAQQRHQNEGYCMELKKHLVLKLVRQFDVIQSDFNCLKEKTRVEDELRKIDQELQSLRLKNKNQPGMNFNRHNDELEKLKRSYNDINNVLQTDVRRIQVGYDAQTLKQIIENTEKQLRNHQNRLNDLQAGKKIDFSGDDPSKIVNLVNQNLKLKEDYCKDYQEYQKQNQNIRNKFDQISAQRSVQHVNVQRYFTISEQIKSSLAQIQRIKQSITGRLNI